MADRTCSVATCVAPGPFTRGWCNAHYHRWLATGDARAHEPIQPYRDDDARFWSHVDRRGDDECWPWTGGTRNGYGRFKMGTGTVTAHRWAYERFVEPIPEGYTIDHVWANGCTRRDCMNYLRHMEPVTVGENNRRGGGVSGVNARKTHCKRNHEFTPENTFIGSGGGRRCRTCMNAKSKAAKARKRAEIAAARRQQYGLVT
jgi:hypothetical protein